MGIDIRKMKPGAGIKSGGGTKVSPIVTPLSNAKTKVTSDTDTDTAALNNVSNASTTTTVEPTEGASDAQIQEYREFLSENGVSDDDIFATLDGLITSGEVFWSFKLLGKIPVTFRSRPTWVNQELLNELEEQSPKTYMRFANIVSLYNLAGALFSFRGEEYKLETVEDLDRVHTMVNALPHAVQSKLVEKLAIFDRLVTVAVSDWAIENFIEPQAAG